MALLFYLTKSLNNVAQIVSVGFDLEGAERFQMPKRQKFVTPNENGLLHDILKKPRHQFRRTKTLRVPLENPIAQVYVENGVFRYKGKVLERIPGEQERRPSASQIASDFSRLRFDPAVDNALEFINKFKELVQNLEKFEPPAIDQTQAKLELIRFFKPEHRLEMNKRMMDLTLAELLSQFYGYYNGEPAQRRSELESLTFDRASSVEDFLRRKAEFLKTYLGNPSLQAKKVQLLAGLPDQLASRLNLDQKSLANMEQTIQYVLLKAEEAKFTAKAIRIKDEEQFVNRNMNLDAEDSEFEYESDDSIQYLNY